MIHFQRTAMFCVRRASLLRPPSAQSLDGVWEITAVIDNGRVVSPTEIRTNYAADGRVTINGQVAQFIRADDLPAQAAAVCGRRDARARRGSIWRARRKRAGAASSCRARIR